MADKTENKPGFVARAKAAVKNFFGKCAKFFRDTKSELKKVVWPSKEAGLARVRQARKRRFQRGHPQGVRP